MPYLLTPSLQTIQRVNGIIDYVLSGRFSYATETSKPVAVPGYPIVVAGTSVSNGVQFQINPQSLGGGTSTLPPFRSLMFESTFQLSGSAGSYQPDTDVIFTVQGLNSFSQRIPCPITIASDDGNPILSGCWPIIAPAACNFLFTKLNNVDLGLTEVAGAIAFQLLTFDVASYTAAGYSGYPY